MPEVIPNEDALIPEENELLEPPVKRFQFNWLLPVLIRPRKAFAAITARNQAVWLTPLLILSVLIVVNVLAVGSVKAGAPPAEQAPPPDFEYYPPEMQDQFYEAMQATSDPVFVYIFPLLTRLGGVWLGWLLMGGAIHLVLTLLGGRGETGVIMNVAAWAGLPLALREVVRTAAVLIARQPIQHPGLAGFAPTDGSGGMVFLAALLALIDVYFIWQVILLVIGARQASELPLSKTILGVLIVIVLFVGLRALVGFGAAQLGSLGVTQPFFF